MNGFDPGLMEHDPSIFPDKKVGDTIGYFSRIVKEDDGKQYVCVMWSEVNCKKCPVDCPFSKNPNRKEF